MFGSSFSVRRGHGAGRVAVDPTTGRPGGHNAGSAYVFVRSWTSTRSQQAKLTASDGADYSDFWIFRLCGRGPGCGRSGNGSVDSGALNAGAAYVFVRSGRTSWDQQAKLDASDGADWDYIRMVRLCRRGYGGGRQQPRVSMLARHICLLRRAVWPAGLDRAGQTDCQ